MHGGAHEYAHGHYECAHGHDEHAHGGHGHEHGHAHGHTTQPCTHQLPVVILTGYLGAGKTTLLNYLLAEQRTKRLAVIENEIGEVSVDDALVQQKHDDLAEELVTLGNGCICCTIRGDLVKTMHDIASKVSTGDLCLDGVLIEMTGAADPAPVVQTFMMDSRCSEAFYVDNVIALVDAMHAIQKLDESEGSKAEKGTACAQIAFSSTVLLNKIDLVDTPLLEQIEKRIKEINSVCDIQRCHQARVDVAKLFNVRAFDLQKVLDEQYMDEEEFRQFYKPKMDLSISNVGVKCQCAMNKNALDWFIEKYLDYQETAMDFLRVKGVVHVMGSNQKYVIQCVHMSKNIDFAEQWKEGEIRESRMIFIGRGMQQRRKELIDGFMECIALPLRFDVGAQVFTRCDGVFMSGVVSKQWDACNPYLIRLGRGQEVHVPVDEDDFVMGVPSENVEQSALNDYDKLVQNWICP